MQIRKQQLELDMDNRLVPNRKWSMSGCILSPCLFNVYAEYIMRYAGLEEAQAGMKTAGRNINHLRYAAEKAMAPHSSTLAWKIPWMEESGRLQSMGSLRVGHD